MNKYKTLKCFAVIFSVLLLIGIFGVILTEMVDVNILHAWGWPVKLCDAVGIRENRLETVKHFLLIYICVIFIFQFIFVLSTLNVGSRVINKIQNSRKSTATSSVVTIDNKNDAKKLQKQIEKQKQEKIKQQEEEEAMKTKEQRLAEKAAKKAEKEQKVEAAVAKVEEKVEEKKAEIKSTKIDDILKSL